MPGCLTHQWNAFHVRGFLGLWVFRVFACGGLGIGALRLQGFSDVGLTVWAFRVSACQKTLWSDELISSMVSIPASLKCCLSWNFDVCRCQASQVLHETGAAVLVGLLLVGMFEALGKHWRHWNWLECWLVGQAYGPNRNSRRF